MVVRQGPSHDDDRQVHFHSPPTTAVLSPPAPLSPEGPRTLQQEVAGLHLHEPPRSSTPPPNEDDDDSTSDWDASDREDEDPMPSAKPLVPQQTSSYATVPPPSLQSAPHVPAPPPPNRAPPPMPPTLDMSSSTPFPQGTTHLQSPWATQATPSGATSPGPTSPGGTNNPFRRPSDAQQQFSQASKHTSVWNALDSSYHDGQSPSATQPQSSADPDLIDLGQSQAEEPVPESAFIKGKGKAPTFSSIAEANPWSDEAGASPASTEPVPPIPHAFRPPPPPQQQQQQHFNGNGIETLRSPTNAAPQEYAPPPGPPPSAAPTGPASPMAGSSSQVRSTPPDPESQKNKIYQVRKIRWFDARSNKNPRESPILVQNLNGPCPLLALVNALSLSTPPNTSTELISTLQNREQISLDLLIQAVFEELMSGRRGTSAQELPDVSELYSFLVTLHTGMNVNPLFVKPDGSYAASAGSFEQTKEMRLYSTFAMPLIHGWIPSEQEDAYNAFARSAQTYEDSQNVRFREEEIEQKIGTANMSPEEQNILVDLAAIKQFFGAWPTQLTDYGLDTIKRSMLEGTIAILFRNDHFSTLYKEPRTKQLMTLVTDAGYAGHDEIVWESLADVSGTMSEMYSGDFRCVSHGAEASGPGSNQASAATQRVPSRKPVASPAPSARNERTSQENPGRGHERVLSEQEDRDLALALQLQEEEDQRHRDQQAAARRRENELSAAYLSNDTPEQRPAIPPRRSGRPATHRPPGDEDPELPTYEQAAASRPYRPPQGHPSSEYVEGQGGRPGARPGMQAGGRPAPRPVGPMSPFDNGRRTHQTEYDSYNERREGCLVM